MQDLPLTPFTKKNLILGVIFIALFLSFYFINLTLTKNEPKKPVETPVVTSSKVTYSGKVMFIGANIYPDDNIKFSLVDSSGKDIILLKSKDDKLDIVEGLNVKVSGTLSKIIKTGESVLVVEEVIINNGSN